MGVKKVTFWVGSASTMVTVPREPGFFSSDFQHAYVESIRITLRLRGRDRDFDIPVEGENSGKVEIIHFEPLKPLRRMNDLSQALLPKCSMGFT